MTANPLITEPARPDGRGGHSHCAADLRQRVIDQADLFADLLALCARIGQSAYFRGHNREALAALAGVGGFDSGVQGQDVGTKAIRSTPRPSCATRR